MISYIMNPQKKGPVYFLTNEQQISHDVYKYEAEEQDGQKKKFSCNMLLRYKDELMRCLDKLIEKPKENIIQYQDFFINPESRSLYIIYEYIREDQFLDYQIYNNKLDQGQKIQVCNDIAKGIYLLHQLDYRHRDINPKNICYVEGKFKLANLNQTAHFVQRDKLDRVGISDYWSQELLEDKEQDETIDIFALACVMFEVFTSQKLFSQANNRQNIPQDKIQALQEIPQNIRQFIIQVVEQNNRNLKQFMLNQGLDLDENKKQQQNFMTQLPKQSGLNNEFRIDMKSSLPTNLGFRPKIGTNNTQFPTLQKPQGQFNGFIPQQMSQQPQQSQVFQLQPFQLQQQQKQQQTFQQQQTPSQQMFKQPQIKFVTTPNINEMPFQQGNLQNYISPQIYSQQFQGVQILATNQVSCPSHQRNASESKEFTQIFSFDKEAPIQQDIFTCEIDYKKEEREREQQRQIEIRNQIQKLVKYGQVDEITQNILEQQKRNEQQSIELILSNLIVENVKRRLGIESGQKE